jgi:hypothetical protein
MGGASSGALRTFVGECLRQSKWIIDGVINELNETIVIRTHEVDCNEHAVSA